MFSIYIQDIEQLDEYKLNNLYDFQTGTILKSKYSNGYIISDLHNTLEYDLTTKKGIVTMVRRLEVLHEICIKNKLNLLVLSFVGKSHFQSALDVCSHLMINRMIHGFGLCSSKKANLDYGTKGHWIKEYLPKEIIVATLDDCLSNGISFGLASPGSFLRINNDSKNTDNDIKEFVKLRIKS